jgi:hypothetical protein
MTTIENNLDIPPVQLQADTIAIKIKIHSKVTFEVQKL